MGIVMESGEAKRTKCTCYQIEGKKEIPENIICFSKGIVGTLSDKQDRTYCKGRKVKSPSKELKTRQQTFTKAMHEASKRYHKKIGKEDNIKLWLDLVKEEMEEDFGE